LKLIARLQEWKDDQVSNLPNSMECWIVNAKI
jgi:hypothetical protein